MYNLLGHMHLHAGSKPFKCPYCSSKFNLKGNLSRHMKVKHGVMDISLDSQGGSPGRAGCCDCPTALGAELGCAVAVAGSRLLTQGLPPQEAQIQQGCGSWGVLGPKPREGELLAPALPAGLSVPVPVLVPRCHDGAGRG